MAICSMLDQKIDNRRSGEDCVFNGYLEDYLNMEDVVLDPILRNAFMSILDKDADTKICVGLRSEINKEAISNQIIRYKDIFKLNGKPLIYPYILYLTKGNSDRALLVVPHTKYSFIQAKGLYYCMTEPGSEFIDCKNEIVALSAMDQGIVNRAFDNLFRQRAGALQRKLDNSFFRNYEELKEAAIQAAAQMKEEAPYALSALEDRTDQIYEYVVNWFLMKKVLYVQYMVNKDLLANVHEGNVKKQRNQAKTNADAVTFMSYSEMWRTKPAENTPETAQ